MFNPNYPATLEAAEEGGFTVTFPDVPEAITEGDDRAEALINARDALETALEMYVEAGEDIPVPGKAKRGQVVVTPPALSIMKLSIYQEMRTQGLRKSDMARALGWHMPQVDRLLNLNHASRLDQVEAAARVLGKIFSVQLADAA